MEFRFECVGGHFSILKFKFLKSYCIVSVQIKTMANKRPAPKDFDVSPRIIKQNRVEGVSPIPSGQAFVFPARTGNHPLSTSAMTPRTPQPTTPVIGITNIHPLASSLVGGGSPQFDFPPQAPPLPVATSSSLVTGVTNLAPALSGISRTPATLPGISSLPLHFLRANSHPNVPAGSPVSLGLGSPQLQNSSLSTLSVPPPPYPSIGDLQNAEEFSCSSPSLFLCSPIPIRPVVSSQAPTTTTTLTSTTEDHNRHPVCSLGDEHVDPGGPPQQGLRARVLKFKKAKLSSLKMKHELILKEKFFLEGGGNMMDFVAWKKKPNILRDQYLKQHDLDSDGVGYDDSLSPQDIVPAGEKLDTESILAREETPDQLSTKTEALPHGQKQQRKESSQLPTPTATTKAEVVVKTEPTTLTSMLTQVPTRVQTPLQSTFTSTQTAVQTPKITISSPQLQPTTVSSPQPSANAVPNLGASAYESSREDIVLRARHEAEIMRAISDLRKEGLWSASRLPKVLEPSRPKTHWDYLLEEMQWLATDFANERRWKMGASKKVR